MNYPEMMTIGCRKSYLIGMICDAVIYIPLTGRQRAPVAEIEHPCVEMLESS